MTTWEDALQYLAQLPEEDRLVTLTALVPTNFAVACRLASHSLRTRTALSRFAYASFEHGDASTLKFWVEFSAARLGHARTWRLLGKLARDGSDLIGRALYWMGRVPMPEAERASFKESVAINRKKRGVRSSAETPVDHVVGVAPSRRRGA